MLKNINYSKILFFDIETVPLEYNFKNLDERGQGLWDRKTRFIQERENLNAEEAFKLSHSNRTASDAKTKEANDILEKIKALEVQEEGE